ncbi:hypoxanthine phosphoribosyltransferase [candidate division CSSED10-310 bacterium]|uniref:Hypoxanthine phosphoribosyltransferase n=1 Tax=candidate division CSSED10-310 bacterium TaxID=2855610 RepID=A0ABV6Z5K1_UNCC1
MTGDIKTLITEHEINKRIREMAQLISHDYHNKQVKLIGILKGAVFFMVDLAKALNEIPVTMDFMDVSSYGASTCTSGEVRVLKDLDEPIENEHVLLVEDIIDTGLTIRFILKQLAGRNPASLKICTLLDKPSRREVEVPIDYIGFTIPNEFVIGFGLDYDQRYRNLPYIGVLSE